MKSGTGNNVDRNPGQHSSSTLHTLVKLDLSKPHHQHLAKSLSEGNIKLAKHLMQALAFVKVYVWENYFHRITLLKLFALVVRCCFGYIFFLLLVF